MRIGLIQDGAPEAGDGPKTPWYERLQQMIVEAELADEMGFDFYGLSEVHFSDGLQLSSPEVLMPLIASRTKRMKLRFVSTVMLSFNHPIRVAERVATLDHVSDGRIEVGTARSNQAHTIEAFGIKPSETKMQFQDSVEVLVKALSEEPFSHDGEIWKIPERSLYPRPTQRPHPPIFVSATSLGTHAYAGEKGLGVMSGNSLSGGWAFVEECVKTYRDAWVDASEHGRLRNGTFSALALKAYCAETNEKAQAEAKAASLALIDLVMEWYERLAKQTDDYAYMAEIGKLAERKDDLPFIIERAPYISIGDPDFFVERCRQLEEIGVDEFMLEIDGFGHEAHMNAIRLIGEEVIPRVRDGATAKEG